MPEIPKLLTTGRLARDLNEPLHRVLHILNTRSNIQPFARAGTLRLYQRSALEMVRHELAAKDASRRGAGHAA